MPSPFIHGRYLWEESRFRGRRTLLAVCGIAMAVALVAALDILGRAFSDVSRLPFRNMGADLIVQRSATGAAVPKRTGIMLPHSSQAISGGELERLSSLDGVEKGAGFVLLWNFGAGRFFSISGVPLGPGASLLGPGRVREWLLKGRLPMPGAQEVLVERHYGAFYRLEPGTNVDLDGKPYTVVGVVEIKQGSQVVASNFYLDVNLARELVALPPDAVNQVFLKVTRIERTEAVKTSVAAALPQASVVSPDSMLKLYGGITQVIGRFRSAALLSGGLAAVALAAMLIYGTLAERRKDAGILRALGWTRRQVRRQLAAEMALHGLIGGLVALLIILAGMFLLSHVTLSIPVGLPGENLVDFAAGGFRAPLERVALPLSTTAGDWLLPPLLGAVFCGVVGWWLSSRLNSRSAWSSVKSS